MAVTSRLLPTVVHGLRSRAKANNSILETWLRLRSRVWMSLASESRACNCYAMSCYVAVTCTTSLSRQRSVPLLQEYEWSKRAPCLQAFNFHHAHPDFDMMTFPSTGNLSSLVLLRTCMSDSSCPWLGLGGKAFDNLLAVSFWRWLRK